MMRSKKMVSALDFSGRRNFKINKNPCKMPKSPRKGIPDFWAWGTPGMRGRVMSEYSEKTWTENHKIPRGNPKKELF